METIYLYVCVWVCVVCVCVCINVLFMLTKKGWLIELYLGHALPSYTPHIPPHTPPLTHTPLCPNNIFSIYHGPSPFMENLYPPPSPCSAYQLMKCTINLVKYEYSKQKLNINKHYISRIKIRIEALLILYIVYNICGAHNSFANYFTYVRGYIRLTLCRCVCVCMCV